MKIKNIKLMLLSLLAMIGSNAFAQISLGDIFPDGDYIYQVTTEATANGDPGEVTILGVRQGKTPIVDGALVLKATCSATVFEDLYLFKVTSFAPAALRTVRKIDGTYVGTFTDQVNATSVEFPRYIKAIPATALDGYTNMNTVSFAANSELISVASGAFATTQITKFDFGNCKKLAGLGNDVFVEFGKINSFITEVTLPGTTLFKSIGAAFANLTSLTTINGLENSSVQDIIYQAFNNDTKLKTLSLPKTVQTIANGAFENSGIETLTIDVTSMDNLGFGSKVYGATNVLKSLTLKGDLGGVIGADAFKGATKLETLNLSGLNFASQGQIAAGAFEGCNNSKFKTLVLGNIMDQPTAGWTIAGTAFKDCTKLESVTFGDINSAQAIEADAFVGCTKLATVTVGNINAANAIGNKAFGKNLKTVTVGTVKAGAISINAGAFTYGDYSAATLSLANGAGQYVSSDDASANVIAAGAFDFSAVVNAGMLVGFVWPEVTIGEIRSQGGAFAAGALTGDNIAKITFNGDIAKNGLDAMIIDATCTVDELVFNGAIGIGGIAGGAFANLLSVMTIDFNGELAEAAVAANAFANLPAGSLINYSKAELTDATVNPFAMTAFSTTWTALNTRTIELKVANADLKANYEDKFEGLGRNFGDFEIYEVKFYVAPTPPKDYNKFYVYQDGDTKTAWARYWESTWDDLEGVGTLPAKKIARYQTVEGGAKVKLTLYGTYTDDPGLGNDDPTIFMVPLQAFNGFYELPCGYPEAVIVKAEIIGDGSFANKDVELSFSTTTANDSWWGGLHNADLYINGTIITNQQLIDKTVFIPGIGDIYAGGSSIAYDLYVMNNPAKYKGFRIDKNEISKEKKTYIGEGWWYMMLRKTTGSSAKVVWMDDAEATGIFDVKNDVKAEKIGDNAIYTLQGVRVSEPQKGQIYIMNGKKFIAK